MSDDGVQAEITAFARARLLETIKIGRPLRGSYSGSIELVGNALANAQYTVLHETCDPPYRGTSPYEAMNTATKVFARDCVKKLQKRGVSGEQSKKCVMEMLLKARVAIMKEPQRQ